MIRKLILTLAILFCASSPAWAVNCAVASGTCFWIGGTGTLDLATDSAHWSNTSGGVTCSCEPLTTNTLTFDGSSGGGTVTVNANITANGITADAFTGTLDWATNNNNVTINAGFTFSMSGAATHTLNMGSGTWTINGQNSTTGITLFNLATDSALTLSAASVNLVFAAQTGTGTRTLQLGTSRTYGTITFASQTSKNGVVGFNFATGLTVTTLNVGAGNFMQINVGFTATNLNFTGNSATLPAVLMGAAGGTTGPITITTTTPSGGGVMFRGITLSGGSAALTNCFDMFSNSFGSNTCTAPSTGGGGFILGSGWLLNRDLNHANDNSPFLLNKAG